jgi:hypothetical protein
VLNFTNLFHKLLSISVPLKYHWILVDNIEVVVSFITAHNVELRCFVDVIGGPDFMILALVYGQVELIPVAGNVEGSN